MKTPVDVTYLADCGDPAALLRGRRARCAAPSPSSRSAPGKHEDTIREFWINDGLHVGEPLVAVPWRAAGHAPAARRSACRPGWRRASDRRRPGRPLRALVLAPRGRDSAVAASLIEQAGVACRTCRDLAELVEALDDDVAFVLMTEEAIRGADLKPLSLWLAGQPAWSDLPFVLVTDHGGGPERNPIAARWLEALGNVSFIERPFHPTTLLSVARATVKGRRRQHETRSLLEDLRAGRTAPAADQRPAGAAGRGAHRAAPACP